jgi:hypothetical protein
MKARNIPVTHATIRQLQADPELNINSQDTKDKNITVTHVTIKQLTKET